MIQEKVINVESLYIVTGTGKKVPIGNRNFEIGETVWTDGGYVFGTRKNTNFPISVMGTPGAATEKYFIWQGVITNPIFRIYNAETLEYMEIPGTIIGGRFIYNSNGTKFAWLGITTSGNQITTTVLTANGYTNFTVTLPYSYERNIFTDGYIDDIGDIYWSAYINDFEYVRYFNATEEVFNTSGHVAIIKYKNAEMVSNHNLTDDILSQGETAWQESLTASKDSSVLITKKLPNPSLEEVLANVGLTYANPNSHLLWEDVWLFADNIITSANVVAINRPQLSSLSIDFVNFEQNKINVAISFNNNYLIKSRDGNALYTHVDSHNHWTTYPYQTIGNSVVTINKTISSDGSVQHFDEKIATAYDTTQNQPYFDMQLGQADNPLTGGSMEPTSAFTNFTKTDYNLCQYQKYAAWDGVEDWETHFGIPNLSTEYIYYFELNTIEDHWPQYGSFYYINSCSAGNGYTFEEHQGHSDENGFYPAYFLLKNGSWSMDVSTIVDNFTNFATPPQVTPLDDERILFLNCPNNALYMINITDNSKQLLSEHYTDNGRIPLVTGQTQAELIRILTKVPS